MPDDPTDVPDDPADEGHDHADVRYLDAKQSVDEQARNRRVREELQEWCPSSPSVFDAGCGTGVVRRRLREWGLDPTAYHGVDRDERLIDVARVRAAESGRESSGGTVEFTVGDAVSVAADLASNRPPAARPDLLVAQSFLDLVPVEEALATLTDALAPGGLVYAPLTFDGVTTFQPGHPADAVVERAYHRAIDAVAGRDSHAGRRAVATLQQAPGDLLAVGGSDWIVRPQVGGLTASDSDADVDGEYPADERYFLDRILGYVASSLLETGTRRLSTLDPGEIDAASVTVDAETAGLVRDWLHSRRRQLENGEVSYFTHQFDLLYRTPVAHDR